MDMYKRDIIKLAKKFGIENRINQTQEECAELIQALSKYKSKEYGNRRNSRRRNMFGTNKEVTKYFRYGNRRN